MTNKNLTEIAFVLDRSGSMSSIADDMAGGYATFIAKQRAEPGECVVSLYKFDSVWEPVYEERPIAEVPPLDLVPRGSTALFDAVGYTLSAVGQRLAAKPESERPGKVILVVITDGHENASREWRASVVNAKLTEQREKYGWQVVFIGANVDAWDYANRLGIAPQAARGMQTNTAGVQNVYGALSRAVVRYRSGAGGQSTGISIDSNDEP